MGDQVISSIAPTTLITPDAPTPDDQPPQVARDDNVNAQNAHAQTQKELGAQDRYVQVDQPAQLQHTLVETVVEATAYRGTQPDDELARKARGIDGGTDKDGKPIKRKAVREQALLQEEEHLGRVEQRIGELASDIDSVAAELENLGSFELLMEELAEAKTQTNPDGHPVKLSPQQVRLQALIMRLAKLEVAFKQQFMLLLAGGIGFTINQDPRLTFKRLFDRFKRWPKRARPGHQPQTDEEYDEFVAWVFEPPSPPEDETELPSW